MSDSIQETLLRYPDLVLYRIPPDGWELEEFYSKWICGSLESKRFGYITLGRIDAEVYGADERKYFKQSLGIGATPLDAVRDWLRKTKAADKEGGSR